MRTMSGKHRLNLRSRRGGDLQRDERGAALVEMAMVLLLLTSIFIGIAELGVLFRDWLSVSTATRAGVRVGSAAGTDPMADCWILEATAGTLISIPLDSVQEVWVFRADSNGDPTADKNVFRPGNNVIDPGDILACGAWTKSYVSSWDPGARNVGSSNLDIIGIRISFDHNWLTGFGPFNGTISFDDDAVMRMEPQFFG